MTACNHRAAEMPSEKWL